VTPAEAGVRGPVRGPLDSRLHGKDGASPGDDRVLAIRLPLPLLVALLTLALAAPPAGRAQQPAGSGAIVGTVLDALTRRPLGNVQVTAHPAGDTATVAAGGLTDAAGRFTVTGLGAGEYR